MTARSITAALFWRYKSASALMIPRFTPAHWWECDLWRLNENGLVTEYEIKLTVADFKKDFEKDQDILVRVGNFWSRTTYKEKKHTLLAEKSTKAPNRFWFVVADDIFPKIEVPPHAGLIVAKAYGRSVALKIQRQAPMLHREKWQGNPVDVAKTFYWRFWNQEAKAE